MWEWNGLPWEHFIENQCGRRTGRDRKPDVVGRLEESHRQNHQFWGFCGVCYTTVNDSIVVKTSRSHR